MKYTILFILGFLVNTSIFAQDHDAEKMTRDIEVAEDVLIKLIQQQLNTEKPITKPMSRAMFMSS